jgi:hypothetical protein
MLLAKNGEARMVYIVRGTLNQQAAGTFTAEAKTERDAREKARDLRRQGLTVVIIGPDGKPIDKTVDE